METVTARKRQRQIVQYKKDSNPKYKYKRKLLQQNVQKHQDVHSRTMSNENTQRHRYGELGTRQA